MKRIFFVLLLTGCGLGDKSDDTKTPESMTFNDSGFPVISGEYSFNTSRAKTVCSNGGEADSPPASFNVTVEQSRNEIKFITDQSDITGVTVIEKNDWVGLVGKAASFNASRSLVVKFDGLNGVSDIDYVLSGKFAKTSWTGEFEYTILHRSYGTTCNVKTTFSGDKL